jgi:hypothetical protein
MSQVSGSSDALIIRFSLPALSSLSYILPWYLIVLKQQIERKRQSEARRPRITHPCQQQHLEYHACRQFDLRRKKFRKMVNYNHEMVEEKKTEDAHEVSLPFDDDASSTSSILKKGELLVDSLLNSSMSSLISTDENLELSHPLPEKRRIVSFTGIGDSPAIAANIPTGASREESLEREVRKLREKMTEVQIDYQSEKATRKRKEKNLVKLAKHCRETTAEIEFKDKQIRNVSLLCFLPFVLACLCLHSRKPVSLRINTETLSHE